MNIPKSPPSHQSPVQPRGIKNGTKAMAVKMASESETWWEQHYTSHSIRDLQLLPIFNRFTTMHFPFQRSTDQRSESYKMEGALDTLEWADEVKNEGEKFSHDKGSDLWHYEHRFQGPEAHITTRAWLSPEAEWGEIEHKYFNYILKEAWRLKGSTRKYERTSLQGGEKRGIRVCHLPAQGGMETWTETFWEKEGETEYEKVWERPGASGGETKHSRGDHWWGEVWHQIGQHTEKKSWHTRGDKDWGHVHGEAPGKVWDENWDISKEKRNEEKLTHDGDRISGFRYLRNGPDFYKQEWDGLAILDVKEGIERLKTAEMRQDLDEICSSGHDLVLKGEHSLELMIQDAPQFKAELEEIRRDRVAIPKPNSQDVDSLLTAIRADRDLSGRQEMLKQRVATETHISHAKCAEIHSQLELLLLSSQQGLEKLSDTLQSESVRKDTEDWGKHLADLIKQRGLSSLARAKLYTEALKDLEQLKRSHLESVKGGLTAEDGAKIGASLGQVSGFVQRVNSLVRGQEDLKDLPTESSLEALILTADRLAKAGLALEPLVSMHESKVRELDSALDQAIRDSLPFLRETGTAEGLLERHYENEDVAVLGEKTKVPGGLAGTLKEMKENNEELELIIEQKSEEITAISTMMDEQKQQIRKLEDEVLELRKGH